MTVNKTSVLHNTSGIALAALAALSAPNIANAFDGNAGDTSEAFGAGYVFAAQKWLDLYGGLKQHKVDRPGSSYGDISFVTAGLRLKF